MMRDRLANTMTVKASARLFRALAPVLTTAEASARLARGGYP
jgi:hypothetical protein